jgi:hypothetical protein
MTTREQIIKKLENLLSLKIENDFVKKGTAITVADEILALFEDRIKLQVDINDRLLLELKECYPKEFVEWKDNVTKSTVIIKECKYYNIDGSKTYYSIEGLYEYWKNLPK